MAQPYRKTLVIMSALAMSATALAGAPALASGPQTRSVVPPGQIESSSGADGLVTQCDSGTIKNDAPAVRETVVGGATESARQAVKLKMTRGSVQWSAKVISKTTVTPPQNIAKPSKLAIKAKGQVSWVAESPLGCGYDRIYTTSEVDMPLRLTQPTWVSVKRKNQANAPAYLDLALRHDGGFDPNVAHPGWWKGTDSHWFLVPAGETVWNLFSATAEANGVTTAKKGSVTAGVNVTYRFVPAGYGFPAVGTAKSYVKPAKRNCASPSIDLKLTKKVKTAKKVLIKVNGKRTATLTGGTLTPGLSTVPADLAKDTKVFVQVTPKKGKARTVTRKYIACAE